MTSTGEDCLHSPDLPAGHELSTILSTAAELDATSFVVLLLSGGRLEAVHRWTKTGETLCPRTPALRADPETHRALAAGGVVAAADPAACFLRAAASSKAQSFLLFARPIRKCVVAIAFGFAEDPPRHPEIPRAAAERLDLAAFATWSSRQLNQLHTELQAVNQKLAGRKLVERAKALLQAELQLDEPQAYEYLRKKSRQRRITIVKLAEEVLRRAAGIT